ncbi:coiled-coil domain-containing protein 57 [Physeter macrocephalus]|uniref:Coiled-coil domain-containing protein 57 n=1 Tax=Physeter macrocephalus TaxID=9755 RepID=A0A455C1Y0_PHYMC|nr:coiled-coil domain-containing protein 57 [Physeter catodon]|eukprot:XP_028353933.1 coiled-coil domain-containing protein 57 [Physeter catodon]
MVGCYDAICLRKMKPGWALRTPGQCWKLLLEPDEVRVVRLQDAPQKQDLHRWRLSILESSPPGQNEELVPADSALLKRGFTILSYSPWTKREAEEGDSASRPQSSTQGWDPGTMSCHEIVIVIESVLILLLFYQQPCGSPFSWALVPGLSLVVSLSRGCSSTKVWKYRKEKTPGTHCGSFFDSQGGAVPVNDPSTGLAFRRLGDRAHLLSFLVAQLRQKVLREPLDMDTIQRELPHELDQVHLEVLQLWKQVTEIEKHLRSARKEGRGASGRQQPHTSDPEAVRGEGPARGGPTGTEDEEAQPSQALSVPRLQRKLKEAARKILRLRLEKEQLLELGNRLRAELGHLTGKLPHHPLPTPEAQGSGEAPDVCLGPLQPRLTTQDSKNAKKECFSERSGKSQARLAQTVCRRDAEPGCTAGPGLRQHRISTVTCRSAPQKENQSPKPRLAQEFQEENGHHTQRSSSLASSSLQDTWKLLDLGSSPSGLTSQDDSPPEHPAPPAAYSLQHPEGSPVAPWAAFAVEGMKMEAQARGKPARPPRAHPAKPKGCQRPPKIRNYNSKD